MPQLDLTPAAIDGLVRYLETAEPTKQTTHR